VDYSKWDAIAVSEVEQVAFMDYYFIYGDLIFLGGSLD
jgi:hypothetical protein